MLKQRVITALLLLAVLLPALFYPAPEAFMAVVLLLVAAAGWEWGRLLGWGHAQACGVALCCTLLCIGAWWLGLPYRPLPLVWLVYGSAWILMGVWLLHRGVPGWGRINRSLRLFVGMLVLLMAWIAIAQARSQGVNFLLSIMLLVWVADIAAYFAGRKFGLQWVRVRLAPSISPGKTWEGVAGAVAGVMLLASLWVYADAAFNASDLSLYSRLATSSWPLMLIATVFLAAASVMGDLIESLIKRSSGVKDSSNLLPGHGGVLDRVDALLPTLPMAMMLVTWLR